MAVVRNSSARATAPVAEAGRDFLVRRDIAFLNHGSYGARPRPVFAAYQRWQRELETEPVAFLGRKLSGLLADARARLAASVGTQGDNLVFVPNTTHGINIIARSLPLQPGDEVLATTHEYGAVERTWRFICEQRGAGFLFARPERQQMLEPLIVSWGWQARTPGPSRFQDYFEWIGTDDPAAYLSVPTAIEFQAQHEWPAVRAACHSLASQARERIGALTGLPHICPDTAEWWGQMCAVPLPIADTAEAESLQRRLWEEEGVEVPIVAWQDRFFVRVSIQAYNSPRDVDRLLDGLARLL